MTIRRASRRVPWVHPYLRTGARALLEESDELKARIDELEAREIDYIHELVTGKDPLKMAQDTELDNIFYELKKRITVRWCDKYPEGLYAGSKALRQLSTLLEPMEQCREDIQNALLEYPSAAPTSDPE